MFGLSWLTSKITVYGAAILGGLLIILKLFSDVKQSGIDAQKAKEAAQHEKDLDAIKRASTVKPVSMQSDPNNRDNGNP